MSAFHEWEANQRYNEVLRTARRHAGWNLEDGRLPRGPSLMSFLMSLFRRGETPTDGEAQAIVGAAPHRDAAAPSRGDKKAS